MQASSHRTLFYLGLSSLFICPISQAEIITDGTVGPALELGGPNYLITPELGSQAGNNLFHSFQSFNLNSAESATFSGPDSLQNIISRVTGGEISNIDGLLQSQAGNADFYFLNPAGVMFGPNAQVDVPAAFHVSTADALIFADGQSFSAVDPNTSSLSIEAPSGFDFLAQQPAQIFINGSSLSLQPGTEASISGGDVTITSIHAESQTWVAPGGSLTVTAMGQTEGQLPLDTAPEQPPSGNLTISSAQIDMSGDGGGNLQLQAGPTSIYNTNLWADNYGAEDTAQGIDISAESLSLTASAITTFAAGEGNGGDIQIETSNFTLLDQGYIASNASGTGGNGSVSLIADSLVMDNFSAIETANGPIDPNNSVGSINIEVAGLLEILDTSWIKSSAWATGNSGLISIQAGQMLIDGNKDNTAQEHPNAGISTFNMNGDQGGNIEVQADGRLDILDGGMIVSNTYGTSLGSTIIVDADQLHMGGNGSNHLSPITTQTFADGDAGAISVNSSGSIELLGNAYIGSTTYAGGNAGSVSVEAAQIHINGEQGYGSTGIWSGAGTGSTGNTGNVHVNTHGLLEVLNTSEISNYTAGSGDSGKIAINANQLIIDGGGNYAQIISRALPGSEGQTGLITINVTDQIEITDGGSISSITYASGDTGTIDVAADSLHIDSMGNTISATGIRTNAQAGSSGNAGNIGVTLSNHAEILNGGSIYSTTLASGDTGAVEVSAGSLRLDGMGATNFTTSISTGTQTDSSGNAQAVNINISGLLEVLNGSQIVSAILGTGDGGAITINAGQISLDGMGGHTAIASESLPGASGNSGNVTIATTGLLEILQGGFIDSITFTNGDAGKVTIEAGEIRIIGTQGIATGIGSSASKFSTGQAGDISINTGSFQMLGNTEISNVAFGEGDGGLLEVHADNLHMSGMGGHSLITSEATEGSSGDAGTVEVEVSGLLELINGASINSNTNSSGNAGTVEVTSSQLSIDNGTISSAAIDSATGNTGNLAIYANELTLSNEAKISIEANQILPDEQLGQIDSGNLVVEVSNLNLNSASLITAQSTGNVSASDISISSDGILAISDSAHITTAANEGDGGDINIQGQYMLLQDGFITTSVGGIEGNGGNIDIQTEVLVMDTGFIQANTAADGASGGTIQIDTPYLLTQNALSPQVGSNVDQGFEPRSGLNVIQAAAPGGESGQISLGSPELDISASISALSTEAMEKADMAEDVCSAFFGEAPSSLAQGGRGGVPIGLDRPVPVSFGIGSELPTVTYTPSSDLLLKEKQIAQRGCK